MNSGFHLVPAHSVETLASAFTRQIARRENPLLPETVLVMNYAQGVWLKRFVAKKLGICANIRFLSPEKFLSSLVSPENSIFSCGALMWRLFCVLRKMHAPDAGTPENLRFETDDGTDADFLRAAQHLGDLFWRYQSFRPKMIRDWGNDAPPPPHADADFLFEYRRQKNLWRATIPAGETPPAIAWLNLLESENLPKKIPARIFAFAPSALPKIHFELLKKLAGTIDVFLYFHNLSSDFWTESADDKKRLREQMKLASDRDDEAEPPATDGCELLSAWGKAARPLTAQLIDDGFLDADANRDAPPAADSLLHALQRDIRENSPVARPFVPATEDDSLKISIAPSPLREMEILRDELISRFAKDPSLAPSDVLIMLSNIKTYAPFICAVFENSEIPFSIADRTETETETTASKFLEILRLAQSELRIDEILSLLDSDILRHALDLDPPSVSAAGEMLAGSGIRWGADFEFRRERIFAEENLPAEARLSAENNSWAFGLSRLALGYMLGTDADEESTEEIFGAGDTVPATPNGATFSILPVGGLTEGAPDAFGKIARFIKILSTLNRAFSGAEKRSVPAWLAFLQALLLDNFLDADGAGAEIVRAGLSSVEKDARVGSLSPKNPPECTLGALWVALSKLDWSGSRAGGGMLRGKITFCEMRPLRNIPAKIIGIAGLDYDKFPRDAMRDSADLTLFPARNFPAGTTFWDRSPRDDDCLLFLEAILAAKQTLLLSYVGRTPTDGQPLPPCVPLNKLRDYLLKKVARPDAPKNADEAGAPAFETLHRLHGFSAEYFSADSARSRKFFSFSKENYALAAGAETARSKATERFAQKPHALEAREREALSKISMRQLAEFFGSSAEFICKHRFDIARPRERDVPEADDPEAKISSLDECAFHRAFVEKIFAHHEANAPGEAVSLEEEVAEFRHRSILRGETTPLSREKDFIDLKEDVKDSKVLSEPETIPAKLSRVDSAKENIPPELVFEINPASVPAGAPSRVRVSLDFGETLFRTPGGSLFLALFGKKEFGWRALSETFVAAQMLAAAFPRDNFTVMYFAYGESNAKFITRQSLAETKMTPADLVKIYAAGTVSPPLFFKKLPVKPFFKKDPKKGPPTVEAFLDECDGEWEKKARDAEEIFVFGENAPETFRGNLEKIVFPFVRTVCTAFREKAPQKPKAEKPESTPAVAAKGQKRSRKKK